jgi:small-conductance mechanosensitive channel
MASLEQILVDALAEFAGDVEAALPRVFTGIVFLLGVYAVITIIRTVLRRFLDRLYPGEEQLIADFALLAVTIGLWFAAALALLSVLGLEGLAASMGTATGFLALGIAYALSDMIADTVAGLYLLRDPDFNAGDRVTTADVTGEVLAIGLRKSRLEMDDGDVLVLANQAVEKRWRRET